MVCIEFIDIQFTKPKLKEVYIKLMSQDDQQKIEKSAASSLKIASKSLHHTTLQLPLCLRRELRQNHQLIHH